MRNYLFWVFIFSLLVSCSKISEKPNFIIILTDDQGWGDLELTGNPVLKTPNLNNLADSGSLFNSFYVSPVCSPTRSEILTGNYHPRTGVIDVSEGGERINLDQKLISDYFKENNYKTAFFGKWHNGQQYPYHPNSRGFDEFIGYCSGHIGEYFNAELEHNGEFFKSDGYLTDYITDNTIDFIESNDNSPFFVFLSINTPHSPMQIGDEWWSRFEELNAEELSLNDLTAKETDKAFGASNNNTLVNHTKAAYAMIENIDWNVGRIMKSLLKSKKHENTVVIFLGDNGPNGNRWNDSLKGRKGSTDEGGVRSPLIFSYPKVNELIGEQMNHISSSIDILPTLLDIADIEYDNSIDGISLMPFLLNKTSYDERIIFSHWKGNVSLRFKEYRLDKDNKLYNVVDDKSQIFSLNNDSIKKYLVKKKNDWIDEVLNTSLSDEKRPFTISGNLNVNNVLPARDSYFSGGIKRSNRYPNDSFLTNWSKSDSIYWPIQVMNDGLYSLRIFINADNESLNSELIVSTNNSNSEGKVNKVFISNLRGMENDRVPRIESYLKDFDAIDLNPINLTKQSKYLSIKRGNNSLGSLDFKRIILKSSD
tara:strand:- start:6194 stop:7972 length:1779 start_codon:yes stop_codon:yes gene_type:complete